MVQFFASATPAAVYAIGISVVAVVTVALVFATVLWSRKARKEETAETVTDEPAEATPTAADEPPATAEETAASAQTDETTPTETVVAVDEPVAENVTAPVAEPARAYEPAIDEIAAAQSETQDEEYPAFIERYAEKLDTAAWETFERVVLRNTEGLVTRVQIPVSGYAEENAFLRDCFRSFGKFKKLLPIAVSELLYEKYLPTLETEKARSQARRKMIAAYWARRGEEDTLGKCETLCIADINVWFEAGLTGKTLPPLKKLVGMLTSGKRFDEAIDWCDKAIAHGIIDSKGEGYFARQQRILDKKQKELLRQEKLRKKEKQNNG